MGTLDVLCFSPLVSIHLIDQASALTRAGVECFALDELSGTPLSQDGRTGRECNSHPHFGSLTDGALERCFRMSDWRLLPCPQTKRPFANRKVGPEVYGIWIPSIPLMTTDFVFFAFKNENSDSGNGGASTQSRGFTFRPSVDWQVHTESPRPPRR